MMSKVKLLKRLSIILFLFTVLIAYNNCGQMISNSYQSGASEAFGSATEVGPVFAKGDLSTKVHSILQRKCASCHNKEISFKGIDDITNLSMLKSTGLINKVYLTAKIGRMPPSEPLTPVELSYIDQWRKGKTQVMQSENYSCSVEAAKISGSIDNRLWTINRDEYKNVIQDIFNINDLDLSALPEQLISDHFRSHINSMVIDDYVFSILTNLAEKVAQAVARDENKIKLFWSCNGYNPNSASKNCKTNFIKSLMSKLHRKKVTAGEMVNYLRIFNLGSTFDQPVQKGVENIVFAALISPNFLYKKEIGNGMRQMSNLAIAESLAFKIWQSVPDQELLNAAQRKELQNPQLREKQIRRMLSTDKGRLFFNRFIKDYFEIDNLQKIGSNQNLKDSMLREFNYFVDDVMRSPASFDSLFKMSETVLNHTLARDVYKIPLREGRYLHNTNERAGILTLPAYLYSTSDDAGVPAHISRGVFVREKLLCQKLGDPPALDEVAETSEDSRGNLTARERFERTHLTKKSCKSCHSMIDPIGFGLDIFNEFGAIQPTDANTGGPIDTKGYVNFTTSTNFSFDGAAQLSSKLGDSEEVADCFVEQSYRYITGAKINAKNLCSVERMKDKFRSSNRSIFELAISILNENENYYRQ